MVQRLAQWFRFQEFLGLKLIVHHPFAGPVAARTAKLLRMSFQDIRTQYRCTFTLDGVSIASVILAEKEIAAIQQKVAFLPKNRDNRFDLGGSYLWHLICGISWAD
jgi:hypothetical protein